jgi:AraC-like DNA-binding protein
MPLSEPDVPPALEKPLVMEAWDNRLSERHGRTAHSHGGNEFRLILDPGASIIHDGAPEPALPGTLFLGLPDEEHGHIGDGTPTRVLVVNYEPDLPSEAHMPCMGKTARRVWRLNDQQIATYIDLVTRMQVELDGRRPLREYAAAAWLRLIIALVARLDGEQELPRPDAGSLRPVDADVLALRRAIDLRRQGSAKGALHELVDNYDALRHRFRAVYGESPGRMLARLRVDCAKSVLISSDMSMAEVARHAGYARQHEFARAFHRAVGCTPTAFRRQARGRQRPI